MDAFEPLPLIRREEDTVFLGENEISEDCLNYKDLRRIGLSLIIGSFLVFIISVNSLFKTWRYIISPLKGESGDGALYNRLFKSFEVIDDYVLKIWSIYIMMWFWAGFSWLGLKLFRHSKGVQMD